MNILILYLKKKLVSTKLFMNGIEKKSNNCSIYKSKLQIIRNFMIKILENTKSCLSLCRCLEVFISCNTVKYKIFISEDKYLLYIESIFQELNSEKNSTFKSTEIKIQLI